MYVCPNCGRTIETLPKIKEIHDELDGNPWEWVSDCCCKCGGYFEEAYQCQVCDDYYCEDEINDGVCFACLERNLKPDSILNFIDKEPTFPERVNIKSIFLSVFTDSEINQILLNELKKSIVDLRMLPNSLENAIKTVFIDEWANFLKTNLKKQESAKK